MEVLLQRQLCWPELVTDTNLKNSSQIKLVSAEGLETFVPVQLLAAFSPFLNSILASSSSCESFTTPCFSIPSATDSILQLLAQILLTGQTGAQEGFESTMKNLKELQGVLSLLGLNVKLCPKLMPSKLFKKIFLSKCASVVKVEACSVNEFAQYKKPSVVKNSSLNALKDFKAVLKRRLLASKGDQTDKCEEADENVPVSEQPVKINPIVDSDDRVEFKQLGLLRDFKVNLINCGSDENISEETMKPFKDENNVCNVCGGEFSTFASLKRHYCEQQSPVKTCPYCKLTLKSTGALMRHIKWMHTKKNPTERDQRKGKDMKVSSEQARQYECQGCGKIYSHPKSLQRHIIKKHAVKKFKCQSCGKTYSHPTSLRRHLSKEHLDLDLIIDYPQRKDFVYDEGNYRQHSGHGEDIFQLDFCSQNVDLQLNNSARGEDKYEEDISVQEDSSTQEDGSFQKETSIVDEDCLKQEASAQDEYILQKGAPTQNEEISAPCLHCGLVLSSVQSLFQHRLDVHNDATDENAGTESRLG